MVSRKKTKPSVLDADDDDELAKKREKEREKEQEEKKAEEERQAQLKRERDQLFEAQEQIQRNFSEAKQSDMAAANKKGELHQDKNSTYRS